MKLKISEIKRGGNIRPVVVDDEIRALGVSIQLNGQQEAIIVNEVGGKYELVDGERRLEAMKSTGATEIEADVRKDLTPAECAKIQALSFERKNLTPMQKAVAASKLMKEYGEGCEETAAAVLGLSKTEMKLLANLEKLSPKWKKTLALPGPLSLLTTAHLALIARLPVKVQESKEREIINALFDNSNILIPVKRFAEWLDKETRIIGTFKFDVAACAKCQKTSRAQAELFTDGNGEDRCLDPDCFKKKKDAYVLAAVKRAKESNGNAMAFIGYPQYGEPLAEALEGVTRVHDPIEVKPAKDGDRNAFPMIYVDGDKAGEIAMMVWRKKEKQESASETPQAKAEDKEAAKARKTAIETGKALIAAIASFLKEYNDKLADALEEKTEVAQNIILEFGTTDIEGSPQGKGWDRVRNPKIKLAERFAGFAMDTIKSRLYWYGRPGDIPVKEYMAEAQEVGKLIGVDFKKYAEALKAGEVKETKKRK
jgi:ParB/RepB/Spo0J family partition protein